MQRLFAAVLAVTCVVGSTPSFARNADPYFYTAPQGYAGYAPQGYAGYSGYAYAPGYGSRSWDYPADADLTVRSPCPPTLRAGNRC
jgi:hypothetical protein